MSRVLEIVLKGKNDVGAAVTGTKADIASLKRNVDGLGASLSFGLAINAIRGGFALLAGGIALAKGNAAELADSLTRLPMGIGAAIKEAANLFHIIAGTADAADRLQKSMATRNKGYAANVETNAGRRSLELELMDDFDRQRAKSIEAEAAAIKKRQEQYAAEREGQYARFNEFKDKRSPEALAAFDAADEYVKHVLKPQIIEDYKKIQAKAEADRRAIGVAQFAATHGAIADDARQINLAAVARIRQDRARELEAIEEAKSNRDATNFEAWISERRDKRSLGGGSTGTISGDDITGTFRGLAADSRSKAEAADAEQARLQRATNERLDKLIELNEFTGGEVARILAGIGPL